MNGRSNYQNITPIDELPDLEDLEDIMPNRRKNNGMRNNEVGDIGDSGLNRNGRMKIKGFEYENVLPPQEGDKYRKFIRNSTPSPRLVVWVPFV